MDDIEKNVKKRITTVTKEQGITNNRLTANLLAEQLNVKRNTVSHHLNLLVKNNTLLKVNTRPVIFFDKNELEKQFQTSLSNEYESLETLKAAAGMKTDVFDSVIGSDGSLYAPIKQLKAAAKYPHTGLPVLLTGPTGAGKSFLAQQYFRFCVKAGYIAENKKLITLNCAEYADNPELLSSILFGYKKGTFTGANVDKQGLFSEANDSMIFLDEVHRLDAKGQEKLFSFLDDQMITPLGETNNSYKVNARFICATTENINSSFLRTFIRRIPVQVMIPSLSDRSREERESLILNFYYAEAKKIDCDINLNRQVIDFLSSKLFANNVGQLKNAVTLSIANALTKQKNDQLALDVKLANLPQNVFNSTSSYDGKTAISCNDILSISPTHAPLTSPKTKSENDDSLIYSSVIRCIYSYREGLDHDKLKKSVVSEIGSLCDRLVYQKKINRGGIPLSFFKEILDFEIPKLESDFGLKLLGNSIIIFTHYFFNRQHESQRFSKKNDKILQNLVRKFEPQEDNVVKFVDKLLQVVSLKLDMKTSNTDLFFVYMYLASIKYEAHRRPIRALVLAHGYSTASSIADVVNKMFGEQIFDALDMAVDVSAKQIGSELTDYIKSYTIEEGLLLLVDMGSLEGITKFIDKEVEFPIGIINNVSTQMALDVANQIQRKQSLEDILHNINKIKQPKMKILYPQENKKNLIVASCVTGIGTAERIKSLLDESIPSHYNLIINAYEFSRISEGSFLKNLKSVYNVLAIIGTTNPFVKDVPYISLEDLISGKKIDFLGDILKDKDATLDVEQLNHNLMRNFSLERVLNSVTILDVHTVMENVDTFLTSYESLSGQKLSNPVRMAIYVHVSCLIERLIRNTPIETYKFVENNEKDIRQTESFKNIHQAFSVIEKMYSVSIPETEIGYIYDIVTQNTSITA